ncbi:transcriptional regulator, XRE family [Methylocella silvestris BL2]|uniref:Transcriptional regulator, XRE family n=1 Tax=Methylocella silvestris (strain DSM 15510 / CIP 108128 / LMG 27833 / NCIMB 13906 / BL2) TaxID=395965 RepID=B8EQ58_METSB|nr:XRE family transcriptional regulator [Methylocella silvestris]ACK51548.1 transcriptional regulator, XRE family [Methylocella silvestris BL2]
MTEPFVTSSGKARPEETLETGSSAPHVAERTLEEAIGAQIRMHRKRLDITGGELAAAAGLSTGMLSKIENGQISPSLSTLQSLARALNQPLSSFFTPFEEHHDCSFVKAGRGVNIERRGTKAGHHYQLLGHSLGKDVMVEPYLITLSEEARPYASFQHAGIELIYMLTGKVLYRHADRSYALEPGDTLFFDAGAPHGPEELTQLPMTYLSIIIYPLD